LERDGIDWGLCHDQAVECGRCVWAQEDPIFLRAGWDGGRYGPPEVVPPLHDYYYTFGLQWGHREREGKQTAMAWVLDLGVPRDLLRLILSYDAEKGEVSTNSKKISR